MNKLVTLMKATMFDNLTLFKMKSKKKMKFTEKILPFAIIALCFALNTTLAIIIIEPLHKENMDIVLLTFFILYTSMMTLIEGIYKSGSLMFNCKDDNLLLSLPIKKRTILLIRILKFYLFEVAYNSLFLIPAMIVYVANTNVDFSFYLVSLVALFILPIIPVLLSCIIGGLISAYSTRFKLKSFAEIVVTTGSLLAILLVGLNIDTALGGITQKAANLNNMVTSLYYPAGGYLKLVQNFNILSFLLYILINVGISLAIVAISSKVYFKINSQVKIIKKRTTKREYIIKTSKPIFALIKKESNRFINSTVFVANAGFGLALFIVGCIMISLNYENILNAVISQGINLSVDQIVSHMSVVLFGFVCFTSLMTSMTSSMISLEGRAFNILKSFPVKPITVVASKVLTAMLIIIPFLLVGNAIIMIRFKFKILETILIFASSIILPFVAETIGIIVNLKYPRLDAENDTQVVKQSISSMIAVFIGMILSAITIFILVQSVINNVPSNIIIIIGLIVYTAISLGLIAYLKLNCNKIFKNI